MSRLENIRVGVLEPAADNPRRSVDADPDLVDTIKSLGVLEPLVVSKSRANGYVVIAGHRRLAAAKKAGLDEVPCVVHDDLDDRTRAEMMLVENLQREDLSPLEEAAAYQRLLDLGHRQRELAKIVGRSQPHISKRTSLLKLPDVARAAVDAGGITLDDATVIAKLPSPTVTALFKNGVPQSWAIDSAVRKHEAQQKTAAAAKELEKAGVRLVTESDLAGTTWEHSLRHLDVDEATHAGEPCHAATVGYGGQVTYLCVEPARHTPEGASELKAVEEEDDEAEYVPPAETAEQKKARLERERARKAEEAERVERKRLIHVRHEFAATIAAKGDLGDVVEIMAMALTSNVYIENATEDALTLHLVGIPATELGYDERTEKARAFVAESDRNRARFVAAAAVSALETVVDDSDELDDARRYLQWLVARGYEPSDVDRDLAGAVVDEEHEISIEPVGKSARKFRVLCSCGELDQTQTTEGYCREAHAKHVADAGRKAS